MWKTSYSLSEVEGVCLIVHESKVLTDVVNSSYMIETWLDSSLTFRCSVLGAGILAKEESLRVWAALAGGLGV